MNKTIKGNIGLSIIYLAVVGGILLFLLFKNPKGFPIIIVGFVLCILMGYVMFGLGYDYFIIRDDSLLVKNLFFWWKKKEYKIKKIRRFRIYNRPDGHVTVTINENKFTSNSLTREDMFELVDTMQELLDVEVEFPQDPRKDNDDIYFY